MAVKRTLLTLDEASLILRVTPPTLARWATEGKVPAYKTPGHQWRFVEADLVLALNLGRGVGKKDREGRAR